MLNGGSRSSRSGDREQIAAESVGAATQLRGARQGQRFHIIAPRRPGSKLKAQRRVRGVSSQMHARHGQHTGALGNDGRRIAERGRAIQPLCGFTARVSIASGEQAGQRQRRSRVFLPGRCAQRSLRGSAIFRNANTVGLSETE